MAQRSVIVVKRFGPGSDLDQIGMWLIFLCSFQVDWAANIRKAWDFSEEGAHARLEAFLQDGETPAVHIVHTLKNV